MTQATGAGVAEPVDATLARIQARGAALERLLRLQHAGRLPPGVDEDLVGLGADTLEGAVDRLVVLRVGYREWYARQIGSLADAARAETITIQLLNREPVRARIRSGRVVEITGRSVAALIELAAHEARLALLQQPITEARARYGAALRRAREAPGSLREGYRLYAEKALAAYTELTTAVLRHRERLCAHLMTPNGAPARLEDPAPEWWRELTSDDDALLIRACNMVGPERLAEASEALGKKRGGGGEPLTFNKILGAYAKGLRVRPASLLSQDFGQLWAEVESLPQHAELEDELDDTDA